MINNCNILMWWLHIHTDIGEEVTLLTLFRIAKYYFLEDIKLTH